MERRTEIRYEVRFEARATAMGQSTLARVTDISESGISLNLPFPLSPGDPVELEMADSTVFGHVVYSTPENSTFRTGIRANRVALGDKGLSSVLQRVLMDTMPLIPGVEPPAEAHF